MFKHSKLSFLFILTAILNIVPPAFAKNLTTLDNKMIAYTDVGKGKPIVLIHAFPSDQRLWAPQRNGLKDQFRIITFDLWGFGQSTETGGHAVSMSDYADELHELLNQLHIKSAIIGGESMGGYIALSFLKKYPEQVDGLILSNTQSIADNDETKNKRELSAIEVLEHGSTNFVNGFLLKALSFDAPEPTKELVRSIAESQLPRGIASALRGMALRYDTSTQLTSTQLPILIITGTKDMLISPQQSENMHALAPKSRLVSILDAGHLSNLEQPEQWNQAVIEMFGTMNTL